jgi:hypothetical protein
VARKARRQRLDLEQVPAVRVLPRPEPLEFSSSILSRTSSSSAGSRAPLCDPPRFGPEYHSADVAKCRNLFAVFFIKVGLIVFCEANLAASYRFLTLRIQRRGFSKCYRSYWKCIISYQTRPTRKPFAGSWQKRGSGPSDHTDRPRVPPRGCARATVALEQRIGSVEPCDVALNSMEISFVGVDCHPEYIG